MIMLVNLTHWVCGRFQETMEGLLS